MVKQQIIDKAKKLLMKEYNINEADAYKRLRTEAMNKRISIYQLSELCLYSRNKD